MNENHHPAVAELADLLIEEHALQPIEPRQNLRRALGLSLPTIRRREKAADVYPVAKLKNHNGYATREYLIACLAADNVSEGAA